MDTNNKKAIDKIKEIKTTLPPFVCDFVDSLFGDNKATRTILEYARDLSIFFEYVRNLKQFENIKVNDSNPKEILESITVKNLNDYKLYLVKYDPDKIKSSAAFVSRKLSVVRMLYKYFINSSEIEFDVASRIKNPKVKHKEISILQLSEVDSIYEAIDKVPDSPKQLQAYNQTHLRDKAIVTLFFGTGLRVSELVSIDVKDINFLTAEITVKRKGEEICKVNFNEDVENTLKDYIENCRPALLSDSEPDALFLSIARQRITTRGVEKLIKKYALKAGIGSSVTPHELRRTYGNNLYRNTGDIYLASAALNHKNIQTTINHYVPRNLEALKETSKDTTLTHIIK